MNRIELEPVDRVEITILMDNVTDPLLVDQERRADELAEGDPRWAPDRPARVSPTSGVPDALIAEPGFSALVRIEKAGRKRTLLFDTGVSPNGMVENMRRLAIDPGDIEVIVLSHGHWDHVTGMEGLVRVLGRDSPAGDDPSGVLEPPADPAFPGLDRPSSPPPVAQRSRRWGSRSSRNASRRSCSTERC